MNKNTKTATAEFRQWLSNKPANVRANQSVALDCKVELFTTAWLDLASIGQRMNWTIEKTIHELLTHCSELFQTDEAHFMRHLGADDEMISDLMTSLKTTGRN